MEFSLSLLVRVFVFGLFLRFVWGCVLGLWVVSCTLLRFTCGFSFFPFVCGCVYLAITVFFRFDYYFVVVILMVYFILFYFWGVSGSFYYSGYLREVR